MVAVLLVMGLLAFALSRGGAATAEQSPEPPTAVPSAPLTSAEPTPVVTTSAPLSPTADPRLAECTQVSEGFVPNRFTIEALGVDEPIIALDLDAEGNIAAPPLNEPRMASWWSGGPRPGDERGKAVLSIHTYNDSLPPALGNEMYAGGRSQLQPGDLIKLYGDEGQVQCYEYTDALKVWVAEYDPYSDLLVDFEGDPRLAIIICWDFDETTRDWDSRILFYAAPVNISA